LSWLSRTGAVSFHPTGKVLEAQAGPEFSETLRVFGLERGDHILAAENIPPQSMDSLQRIYRRATRRGLLVVKLQRGEHASFQGYVLQPCERRLDPPSTSFVAHAEPSAQGSGVIRGEDVGLAYVLSDRGLVRDAPIRGGEPRGLALFALQEKSLLRSIGFSDGDIITAVDGAKFEGTRLLELMQALPVGQTTSVTVFREGKTIEIPIRRDPHATKP
jgi:membrane-associated protease RseP (regulator of RpoE activity)